MYYSYFKNSADAGNLQLGCGRSHLQNWIKIVTTSPKLPLGNPEKESNAQICRSV
ncbi:hypothetical protein G7B40_032355 [Aetokthonos hydrillicola Thurmond2011]|uniref:Uncharacterized protein n=1 Tax=Aetokthonos hydrillicola Thurmond2011 TaxID=2712845 RepID=A0AAP5IGA3_9CYAN|nr:hypothetical protein [Aetokthonos hydrillicola]MBO3464509.1 hypothetical protein [Aetokthonos hydrillicola CCALA 1050]MBW4585714.1 hypothetical protein [Aetokthonos hydrillicola CCALA 1050]MDR9899218.1 hypothetical protein [Aetokthonos hydrillicola Thurmond2011]